MGRKRFKRITVSEMVKEAGGVNALEAELNAEFAYRKMWDAFYRILDRNRDKYEEIEEPSNTEVVDYCNDLF